MRNSGRSIRSVGFFLRCILLLAVAASAAPADRPAGTLVSWGAIVIPYVPPDTKYRAIATGPFHSVAITMNGSVVAWGDNNGGQADVPAGLRDVQSVSAGVEHSLALKSDGTVVGWGRTKVPANVSNVVAVSTGLERSVALKSDGTVIYWRPDGGERSDRPAGLGRVKAIASTFHDTIVLTEE